MLNRWVAYPFQNNISNLPLENQISCINGLIEAKVANATATGKPANFDEWIMRVMGEGIANVFMRPYNFKVWAIPTELMQCSWLGERVATANVQKVVENVLRDKTEAGWGPNAVFRFPQEGGTGAIWKKVADKCCGPLNKQRYNCKVTNIDAAAHVVEMADGSKIHYDKLMSTLPLDQVLKWVGKDEWADRLTHSSTHVIGLGLRGQSPHDTKCWMYYPEDDCPFYRCTVFSHYAQKNVPAADLKLPTLRLGAKGSSGSNGVASAGPYWSLMFEVSESAKHKPVDLATVVEETIQGAINTKMISSTDEIVSIYHRRIEHGYPTPCLQRDAVLAEALPFLKNNFNIWSRGRFGAYKYEVANQDHSCCMGVEAIDNMLHGTKEFTLFYPSLVRSILFRSLCSALLCIRVVCVAYHYTVFLQTNEGGAKNTDLSFSLKK